MDKNYGVYVGRLCPMHIGHEIIIKMMYEKFGNDFLLVLGSSNTNLSLRNFFSYSERRSFVKAIYPDIRIVGLPDYGNDSEWLVALDDLISNTFDIKHEEIRENVVFAGGCIEDVSFFFDDGRKVEIVNRFDGSTPKISATEVRDALVQQRNLDGLLNPVIHDSVRSIFSEKWEKFKKM